MDGIDALLLARIQFGFTISFHIVFPALTIGLAGYLAVLEGLWLKTRQQEYMDLFQFWIKVFAVAFAMGVVSGLVMAYQFGTNWGPFSKFAGGVTGPLLAYEVLTAFFLEAGFLGVMLFGMRRVGPGLHFFATVMVAAGSVISATWILASNSWMQTPRGYEIVDGRVVPVNWLEVIFNPSFPYRLAHMLTAAYLATALLVAASAAWHLLRGRDSVPVRRMLSMALWMTLIAAPLQAFIGDLHGLNTLEHQPAKLAAIEGHWENRPGEAVPLILIGVPDMDSETTRHAVAIPTLGSILLTHTLDGQIPALKDFPKADRPNSLVVFWTFRLMVGLGLLMILLACLGAWLRRGDRVYSSRPYLKFVMYMGPSGLIALLAGWVTTEVGRQPWVVYGVMRTAEGVSAHGAAEVGFTLALFVVVYIVVFGAGTIYLLRIIGKGPQPGESSHQPTGGPGRMRHSMRPLSGADENLERASAATAARES
jgi:cytochrome d ubiquinol oxidase subunit I